MKTKCIAAITAVTIAFICLSGCGVGYADTTFPAAEQTDLRTDVNLAQNKPATGQPIDTYGYVAETGYQKSAAKATDGNIKTAYRAPDKRGAVTVDFGEEQTINTVILREKGWNVQSFRLLFYVGLDENGTEQWEEFYRQDRIEDIRYCTFDAVTTTKLRLVVDKSLAPFCIREIEALQVAPKQRESFNVTAYLNVNTLFREETYQKGDYGYLDPDYFDTITEVLLIDCARYDESGTLTYDTSEKTGRTAQDYKDAIARFRRDVLKGRDLQILQTAFFKGDPDIIFGPKKDATIRSTLEFLAEHDLDGINYDWEFPKGKQYQLFSDYLVALSPALHAQDKKLSCAWYAWGINLTTEALLAHDQIEIMGYDTFDQQGNNSSFMSGCVQNIAYFLEKGVPPEKINIGIPFYGRVGDASNVWVDYKESDRYPMSRWDNSSLNPIFEGGETMIFNGAQMVADKTAYAIAKNLGGVMLFHIGCDKPYADETSLTRAVGQTVRQRVAFTGERREG